MSATVEATGASLKVKVTTELLSPSLSEPSTMSTVTVGLRVSIVTVSDPAAAEVARSVGVAAGRNRRPSRCR